MTSGQIYTQFNAYTQMVDMIHCTKVYPYNTRYTMAYI